ncbi:MAG: hypothetical protein VXY90_08950 [Pseudomonadota bacterium]|nr:hypothetical protein [Pseudomonadota bacterium]MEC8585724.1 hypothetical protein [Pseudomonadota bacterium]
MEETPTHLALQTLAVEEVLEAMKMEVLVSLLSELKHQITQAQLQDHQL